MAIPPAGLPWGALRSRQFVTKPRHIPIAVVRSRLARAPLHLQPVDNPSVLRYPVYAHSLPFGKRVGASNPNVKGITNGKSTHES
jgi:hypothetical protein